MEILDELIALKSEYAGIRGYLGRGIMVSVPIRSLVPADMEFGVGSTTALIINCTSESVNVSLKTDDGTCIDNAEKLLAELREKAKCGPRKGAVTDILVAAKVFFSASEEQTLKNRSSSSPNSSMGRSSQYSRYVNEFDEGERLGKGGYGLVYKCTNKLDMMTYAVKKIPFSPSEEATVLREAWIEDEAVDLYLSESGTDVLNTSSATKTLYLLMELCPSTLKQKMEEGFDRKKVWIYFKGLVEGLSHIHAKRIIHRDLSRGNIFVDEADNAKIGDFGLAIYDQDVGSPDSAFGSSIDETYHAPEMKKNESLITNKVDIYSAGLILLEMLYPMETTMERNDLFKKIRERKDDDQLPPLDNWEYEDHVDQLLDSLLDNDPFQRPSASLILDTIADLG